VTGVELVGGVSRRKPGIVMFDAEIAADGRTLFVVDGLFTGGPVPKTADPNSGMTRADWGHPGRRCSREARDRAGRTSHHGLATGYNT